MNSSGEQRARVLAFVEARHVTGPVKNLLEFCRWCNTEYENGNEDAPEITLATYARCDEDRQSQFATETQKAGVQLHFISERRRFDMHVLREIRAAVKRYRPNILQTHSVKSHFLLRLSKASEGCPWIAFHHGYTTTDRKMHAYNLLDRWSLRGASLVVTVCKPFVEELEICGVATKNTRILHNSVKPTDRVSPDRVDALRRELEIRQDDLVVLSVGRLSDEKGHRDLVTAFRTVVDQAGKSTHLVIAGEGPERESLARTVRELRLEGRVHMPGHLADTSAAYSLANVVALPSLREGSPNVLLEAMAMGLPVVAASVGGVPEIAQHEETALLVPPRNPTLLGAAIVRLLSDKQLAERLAKNAKQHASLFSPEARSQKLVSIYREVLGRETRSAVRKTEVGTSVVTR